MKRNVKLTEADLVRLVKRVVNEQNLNMRFNDQNDANFICRILDTSRSFDDTPLRSINESVMYLYSDLFGMYQSFAYDMLENDVDVDNLMENYDLSIAEQISYLVAETISRALRRLSDTNLENDIEVMVRDHIEAMNDRM